MKTMLTVAAAALSMLCSCTAAIPAAELSDSEVRLDTKGFSGNLKSSAGILPPVDSFLLSISGPQGVVYEGLFGLRPESFTIPSGEYLFRMESRMYDGPRFNAPIWGDEESVTLSGGQNVTVPLNCLQMTSGVRIIYTGEFRTSFPDASVRIMRMDTESLETESLDYAPGDSGFVHFLPGRITVNLIEDESSDVKLLTGMECQAADMFTVSVDAAPAGNTASVEVTLDTAVIYHGETYIYGTPRSGESPFSALYPSDLPSHQEDTLWVAGYVTGCYVNREFIPGADSLAVSTNIAISDSPAPSENTVTIPVYVYTGPCHSLNLKDNPEVLGRRVAVRGVIGTLYDLPAVKKSMSYIYL